MAMTLEEAVKAYLEGWEVIVNDGKVAGIVRREEKNA